MRAVHLFCPIMLTCSEPPPSTITRRLSSSCSSSQEPGIGGLGNSMTRFLAWSTMVADQNAWGGATYCSYDLYEEFSNYDDKTLGTKVDDKVRRTTASPLTVSLTRSSAQTRQTLMSTELPRALATKAPTLRSMSLARRRSTASQNRTTLE